MSLFKPPLKPPPLIALGLRFNLILSLIGALSSPQGARASLGDPLLGLKLEGGYEAYQPSLSAPYLRAELSYTLGESLLVQGAYSALSPLTKQPAWQRAELGARWQLDVLHYVPWAGVALNSAYLLSEERDVSAPALWSVGLELGLDRKLSETQALSVSFRLPTVSAALSEGAPVAWALGLSWRYDWRLFDPFDQ